MTAFSWNEAVFPSRGCLSAKLTTFALVKVTMPDMVQTFGPSWHSKAVVVVEVADDILAHFMTHGSRIHRSQCRPIDAIDLTLQLRVRLSMVATASLCGPLPFEIGKKCGSSLLNWLLKFMTCSKHTLVATLFVAATWNLFRFEWAVPEHGGTQGCSAA